ncbi:hypothetical protein Pla110_42230 [Polystyrenella longa]|uniref:Uncharacterized protein n=1 Tax=Polystyrenella longa TaxID=2528007 RepID=A0A518CTC5_9PLAN|nr:hypothetical protein [Polystyrenella longa]QDU82466.1 hypothetical protein Pla110_42230 [Polystyrenella longa]
MREAVIVMALVWSLLEHAPVVGAEDNSGTLKQIKQEIAQTNKKLDDTNKKLGEIQNEIIKSRKSKKRWYHIGQSSFEHWRESSEKFGGDISEEGKRLLSSLVPNSVVAWDFDLVFSCSFAPDSPSPNLTIEMPAGFELTGEKLLAAINGVEIDLKQSLRINWDKVIASAASVKLVSRSSYSDFRKKFLSERTGRSVYFCSEEFVKMFAARQVGNLLLAYFTNKLDDELKTMLQVAENELDTFVKWCERETLQLQRNTGKGLPRKLLGVFIDSVINRDFDSATEEMAGILNVNVEFHGFYKDTDLYTDYKVELGKINIPNAWLSAQINKMIDDLKSTIEIELNERNIPSNGRLSHLGFAVVVSPPEWRNSKFNKMIKVINRLNLGDLRGDVADQLNNELEGQINDLIKSKLRSFKGVSENRNILVSAIGDQLPEKYRKNLESISEGQEIFQGGQAAIQRLIKDVIGLDFFDDPVSSLLRRMPNNVKGLCAAFSSEDAFTSLDLAKFGMDEQLKEKVLNKIKLGNASSSDVDEMKYDLQKGVFTIKATIHCKHIWLLDDIPGEFRRFFVIN